MIPFDWMTLLAGLAGGTVISALFFAGLGLGMRIALRRAQPLPVLVLSAALRMVLLLAAGWLMAVQAGPWAVAGFALAFLATRLIVTTTLRGGGQAA